MVVLGVVGEKNTEPVAKAIKKGGLRFRDRVRFVCVCLCVCVCFCVYLSVCVFIGLSCQPHVHSWALEDQQELQVSLQAVQVVGQGTCRWELRGDVEASWEACRREGGQRRAGRASYGLASAGLVPLVLSVLDGEEPWGGDPSGGSRGAWRHRAGALRGGVEVLRGEEEVLRGVAGALQGACLKEVARSGVQGLKPVPVLEPERRRRRLRQLAAPSAASPSSRRI